MLLIHLPDDLAPGETPELPPMLISFFAQHVVLGAAVDSDLFKLGVSAASSVNILTVSAAITRHPLCPWSSSVPGVDVKAKTNLKHVPMLLYGETHGVYYPSKFKKLVAQYPHPHVPRLPQSRIMREAFKWQFPTTGTQRAYCRNDGIMAWVHGLVLRPILLG